MQATRFSAGVMGHDCSMGRHIIRERSGTMLHVLK
jgi:hypothetical protein